MKRSRILLLSVMFCLLALAGMSHAKAVPCIPCECYNNCVSIENTCLARCKGNGACETSCEQEFATCERGCLGV